MLPSQCGPCLEWLGEHSECFPGDQEGRQRGPWPKEVGVGPQTLMDKGRRTPRGLCNTVHSLGSGNHRRSSRESTKPTNIPAWPGQLTPSRHSIYCSSQGQWEAVNSDSRLMFCYVGLNAKWSAWVRLEPGRVISNE